MRHCGCGGWGGACAWRMADDWVRWARRGGVPGHVGAAAPYKPEARSRGEGGGRYRPRPAATHSFRCGGYPLLAAGASPLAPDNYLWRPTRRWRPSAGGPSATAATPLSEAAPTLGGSQRRRQRWRQLRQQQQRRGQRRRRQRWRGRQGKGRKTTVVTVLTAAVVSHPTATIPRDGSCVVASLLSPSLSPCLSQPPSWAVMGRGCAPPAGLSRGNGDGSEAPQHPLGRLGSRAATRHSSPPPAVVPFGQLLTIPPSLVKELPHSQHFLRNGGLRGATAGGRDRGHERPTGGGCSGAVTRRERRRR